MVPMKATCSVQIDPRRFSTLEIATKKAQNGPI